MSIAIPAVRPRHIEEAIRQIVDALRGLADGRSNAIGEVTLAASATSTVVSDTRVGSGSVILLSPMSASAVSADTFVYVQAVSDGGFTLAHDSNAVTDRDFRYAVQG
ncbi:MAG: hypothetical protein RIM84_26080 [Alphaproteobacteria bacterium]